MKKTGIFNRKKEKREIVLDDPLLQAFLQTNTVTRDMALQIPTVAACIELISSTVAMLPLKLYRNNGTEIEEVKDDIRIKILNSNTGDLLNAFQMKKALAADYLLDGAGYAYINFVRGVLQSLNYVKRNNVSFNYNSDPIFKICDISVNGQTYESYQFLKLLRKTQDGVRGTGIVTENNLLLSVCYAALKYEELLMKTGGNKKGFLKTKRKLGDEELKVLKESYKNLYENNTANCMVLNDVDFTSMASSSVDLQMNENKTSNSAEICKIFNVPPALIGISLSSGSMTNAGDHDNFIKLAISPILSAFRAALNQDMLLTSEQNSYFYDFDTRELLKGNIKDRYAAYQVALSSGFMTIDEVRQQENWKPFGIDWINVGLGSVLWDTKTKKITTPNTGTTIFPDVSTNNHMVK